MLSTRDRVPVPRDAAGWFLLKADIDAPDDRLRPLRRDGSGDAPSGTLLALAVETLLGVQVARIDGAAHRGTLHWMVAADLADGRAVVVRVNRLEHPVLHAGLELEAAVARLLASRDFAAPAVLATDAAGGVLSPGFSVTERIDGTALAAMDDAEPAVLDGLRALGGLLSRLHAIRLSGAGPLIPRDVGEPVGRFDNWHGFLRHRVDEHVDACRADGTITGREAARIRHLLQRPDTAAAPVCDRLLHGDPGPANLIIDGGGVAHLVDWEDALVGDPLFELASAASFHPERRWPALFEGYGGLPVHSDADYRRFWLYMLRIALARTVMRRRFGLTDAPGRTPAAARIHRALDALCFEEAR